MADVGALSSWKQIEALVADERLVALADSIQVHDWRDGGRPRHYPQYCLLLMNSIRHIFGGSLTKACRELAGERWLDLRGLIAAQYPTRPDLFPRREAPRPHHFLHYRNTYLQNEAGKELLRQALRRQGIANAKEFGLFDCASGSWQHPCGTQCVLGDGKVVTSASRYLPGDTVIDRLTGEIRRRRIDPDARFHKEGGRRSLKSGHKFTVLSARGADYFQLAILDIAENPAGSELDAVLPALEALSMELPIRALIYDGAIRGTHIQRLFRETGILTVAPVAPKRAASDGVKRVDHELNLGGHRGVRDDGTERDVHVWAVGGKPVEAVLDDSGQRVYLDLERIKLEPRGSRGKYRLGGVYRTHDGAHVRLRIDENDADRARKVSRAEHLRVFPQGSSDYDRLYPLRASAESLNRQLEDSCWQKRANVWGADRVFVDLIGFGFLQNSIARSVQRSSESRAGPQAA